MILDSKGERHEEEGPPGRHRIAIAATSAALTLTLTAPAVLAEEAVTDETQASATVDIPSGQAPPPVVEAPSGNTKAAAVPEVQQTPAAEPASPAEAKSVEAGASAEEQVAAVTEVPAADDDASTVDEASPAEFVVTGGEASEGTPSEPDATSEEYADGKLDAEAGATLETSDRPAAPSDEPALAPQAPAPAPALAPAPHRAPAADSVARVDGVGYSSLDEAVKAASNGSTIEVLRDCDTTGMNISGKSLTIAGTTGQRPTITFTDKGIALWNNVALTFRDIIVAMTGIGSTPYTAEWKWMTICGASGASLTLDNATMTMDGTGAGNAHCIYFTGGNNKLNVTNGSTLTIKNYRQDALEWDGGDGGYNVNITGGSTYISDHNRSGFTGTFYATIDNSTVQVIISTVNGSNGSHFIINKSYVNFSDNGWHGLSTGILKVTDSTIDAKGNGTCGIIFNNKATFDNSTVTITGSKGVSYWNAAMRALWSNASCHIASDCSFNITDNYVTGIFLDAGTSLTIDEGAKVLVTHNRAWQDNITRDGYRKDLAQCGGGVVVRGGATASLSNSTQVYNNSAKLAGDDLYVEDGGTITFGPVGKGWKLDYALDRDYAGEKDHPINGWYVDTADARYDAHGDKLNITLEESGTKAGPLALKAAHGLARVSYKWVSEDNPTDVKVPVDEGAYVYGDAYTALAQDASKQGYTFEGWYVDEACTVRWVDGDPLETDATTLYGKWTKEPEPTEPSEPQQGTPAAPKPAALKPAAAIPQTGDATGYVAMVALALGGAAMALCGLALRLARRRGE